MQELASSLIEIGFSEKEAAIYLSLLQGGILGVQEISEYSGVNRTTVYGALDALQERRLIVGSVKDKRMLYTAEMPERLHQYMEEEMRRFEERRKRVAEMLPRLAEVRERLSVRPCVRMEEGEEAIRALREDAGASDEETWSLFSVAPDEQLTDAHIEHRRKCSQQWHGRCLVTGTWKAVVEHLDLRNWHVRATVSPSPFGTGELHIYRDRATVILTSSDRIAISIRHSPLVGLLRVLFESAWQNARAINSFSPSELLHY